MNQNKPRNDWFVGMECMKSNHTNDWMSNTCTVADLVAVIFACLFLTSNSHGYTQI
jgi:hypothetical protein